MPVICRSQGCSVSDSTKHVHKAQPDAETARQDRRYAFLNWIAGIYDVDAQLSAHLVVVPDGPASMPNPPEPPHALIGQLNGN